MASGSQGPGCGRRNSFIGARVQGTFQIGSEQPGTKRQLQPDTTGAPVVMTG